jgi:hypothetical protein
MKPTLIISTVLLFLLSCNSNDHSKVLENKTNLNQQSATASGSRQRLIEELRKLKVSLASNDKEKIADVFPFPLSDTAFAIYTEDSTFNAEYDTNGGKLTRGMFVRFFPQVSESLGIGLVSLLLTKVKLDSLQVKDTLEYEALTKHEPCYYSYSLRIENELVVLGISMNSNLAFESKTQSQDDIPENASEICEHTLLWIFGFDGKNLNLKEVQTAG